MFIAALFTTAKTWEQHKCPSADKWIKKTWCVCVCVCVCVCAHARVDTMEHYSAIRKNEITPFAATWMELEIIKLSKPERER